MWCVLIQRVGDVWKVWCTVLYILIVIHAQEMERI
jgi:hypothetical protein